jgi:hypothetical protein
LEDFMGRIMKEDDVFIPGLLDQLYLRFGPSQGPKEAHGGIAEMKELQKEFQIFRRGRNLKDCFALLNLGGLWNARVKNRWLSLIEDLKSYDSDVPGENGNDRIMNMLIENLGRSEPLPVFFQAHDSRGPDGKRVIVRTSPTGPFFMEQDHVIVSLPMKPKTATPTAKQAAPAARSARKTASKTASKTATKTPRKTPRGR